MQTRRAFIKHLSIGGWGLFAWSKLGGASHLLASIPGGTLDPAHIMKFATALLIPPVMPKAATQIQGDGNAVDYYEISVRQFSQQILPGGLPATTVWGYGPATARVKRGLRLHNAPSLTIEAKAGRPVRVKWINELVDDAGDCLPHLLPVDPTLHWANPPGGDTHRDSRPDFSGKHYVPPERFTRPEKQYTTYSGPVPLVTHLHGAVDVGDESDGYAEAWYLPAGNIPEGYADRGTWYDFFAAKALGKYGLSWGPGFATFQYPVANRASTLWYHDHALGMTRLNVYAGPAGFFLIRGGPSGEGFVLDSRSGAPAVLPGPAPAANDKFPPNKSYYEIAMAIQDRAFNADGSLFYPNSREFFDGATAKDPGFIPATDVSPVWNPEFFGNSIIVNGNTWPFLEVQQRRYRFRMLNGCQSRFLILDFRAIPGIEVWQIGNEGGFLAQPVNLTASGNTLLMGLAERADLIVDFTNVPRGDYVLENIGPDEPFGGGIPGVDFEVADPGSTGQVLQFKVGPAVAADPSTPPQFLVLPSITPLPAESVTRPLALVEEMSRYWDGPAAALLGTVESGEPEGYEWSDRVTENPEVGATEAWEFYNTTADAHPMHVHDVMFEVINREPLVLDPETGETVRPLQLSGAPRPPEAWENGLKDTVIAYPGEVTRIRVQFKNAGQFVWHCHIVEHEDNEMMRPYRIGEPQKGAPNGVSHTT